MTQTTNVPVDNPNYWQELWGELLDRLSKPWRHPTFVMYFLGIIIFFGGFGWLEPVVRRWVLGTLAPDAFLQTFISAIYTYSLAVTATAAVDLILCYHQRKSLLMFFLLCAVVVFLCALFAAMLENGVAIYLAIFGYLMSLLLWWLGNANNAKLLEPPVEQTAPIGADAKAEPRGDLAGFTN